MTVHIRAKFFAHETGTKFYEVIQLWNADINVFLCVRRWGKVGTAGETQVFPFRNHRQMEADADKIIGQKMKRGYFPATATDGLHMEPSVRMGDITRALVDHYGAMNAPKVAHFFSLHQGKEFTGIVVDEVADIVVEEPAPEPERGGSWGSW